MKRTFIAALVALTSLAGATTNSNAQAQASAAGRSAQAAQRSARNGAATRVPRRVVGSTAADAMRLAAREAEHRGWAASHKAEERADHLPEQAVDFHTLAADEYLRAAGVHEGGASIAERSGARRLATTSYARAASAWERSATSRLAAATLHRGFGRLAAANRAQHDAAVALTARGRALVNAGRPTAAIEAFRAAEAHFMEVGNTTAAAEARGEVSTMREERSRR